MENLKLCESDYRFMCVIWENEPLPSGKLVELCKEKLNWKKTTSFTVIKRLSERGIIQNQKGIVTSLISREEFYSKHSEKYVEETFGGSLPAFLTAFSAGKKLSEKEVEELQKIIDSMRG